MERPGERGTATPPPRNKPSLPALMPAALDELRSAAATYDYLRATGDPAEFWETLRLARSKRALVPPPGAAAAAPGEKEETSMRQALDGIRERFSELVGEVRYVLESATGLPEPAERFEMAFAFLMASARENEFAPLLADPDKQRSKTAEKLRSLAGITDPYREALKPWSLDGTASA
jgi:hypothetical protein